ncbi:HAD family hydrolase [methane-oxidizing endosymbiont of Gigantopelta aegis]|uniref:HAD family hydrolase n=1 Tax=methane-oxidizing endosymbiont of Gigantopelta aegis TaxID=2794938 RepID=UPI0018DCB6DF|nr:HAD-IA family hydrolase [methane-oxidizing endosymbiont of Gigantopelta aegis]
MNSKSIKLIIFDWDGTLVDSIGWIVHCMQYAARQCHFDVPEEKAVRNIIGLSIERALDELFPGLNTKQREHLIQTYSQRFFTKNISPDDVFTGVPEMLAQLKAQGYLLAVATGKRSTGLAKAMQGTGLNAFFDMTRGVDQAASKPDPLMLEHIMQQLRIDKDQALMVGDSIHDLQMAQNANIDAVAVSCGAHPEVQLQQYSPCACLQQTADLIHIL